MSDAVYVRIGVDSGRVLMLFGKDQECTTPEQVSHWHIDPKQCLEICEGMADAAFEADSTLKPVGPTLKATLVENHRMKLTQRFAIMLGTLRNDKLKTDGQIAQTLVESALREIF